MLAAHRCEYLSCRACTSPLSVLKALANAFLSIGARRQVQQSLVSCGVLYHSLSLSVHREDQRAATPFKLL